MLPTAMILSLALSQAPTLSNGLLQVTLDPETGALAVTDLGTGIVFRQPDTVRDTFPEGPELRVHRAPDGVLLDGAFGEWGDAEWVSIGDAARGALLWDDESLYAAFEVTDPRVVGGEEAAADWDAVDHVSWWAGWDQVHYPAVQGQERGHAWGGWQEWAEVAVELTDGGYRVETRSPTSHLITLRPVTPGRLFRTALTVGDGEGRQATYPADLDASSRPTYAVAVLVGEDGATPAVPVPGNRPTDITQLGDDSLEYTLGAERFEAAIGRVRCRVRLPEGERRLEFECEPLDGWEWDMPLLRGFLPEGPSEFVIPYYGNGILVPSDHPAPPVDYLSVFGSLDMPGVGVMGEAGAALCLFESYDYLSATLEPGAWGRRTALSLTAIGERDERGAPASYHLAWEFLPGGGAMDVALSMRRFCADQGWWRTLRDKRAANPNIDRLLGAPIVWGSSGEEFAHQAAGAGVRRLLVAGSYAPDAVQAIVDLGFLSGEYDNYVDADDRTAPIDGVPAVPDLIRRERDGELAKGWLTLDGLHQYFSLCSDFALPAAQAKIGSTLATHPYNARFLDVHTAMGLAECYDEAHPATRTRDRENKTAMLQWIRDQGLVLGGEHGRAWSVPVLDHQEGMMSCNPMFTWPAGHLVPVDDEEQLGDLYLDWGIHPARRVPFWEMVFHGCVVSTWYWGDSVGYFEKVRPDLTDRKIALTALYGAAPLMWATDLGIGFEGARRNRFLQVYNATGPLHESVGYEEMVSFTHLSDDRLLQRTQFADGTVVTANFGPEPVAVTSGGTEWILPQNGMVADGPGIHAHHIPGQETYAERSDYRALVSHSGVREQGGLRTDGVLALSVREPGVIRVCAPMGAGEATLETVFPGIAEGHSRVVTLGPDLARAAYDAEALDDGRFVVPAGEPGVWEIVYGEAARGADLGLTREPAPDAVGDPTDSVATVAVANAGDEPGRGVLRLYWDRVAEDRLEREWPVEVAPGGVRTLEVALAGGRAVGRHRAVFVLGTGSPELIGSDNRLEFAVDVQPETGDWPFAASLDADWQPSQGCLVATVDLGNVRGAAQADLATMMVTVADPRGGTRAIWCQFEPDAPGSLRGRIVAPAVDYLADSREWAVIAPGRDADVLGPVGGRVDLESGRVRGETYEASLLRGSLRDLRMVAGPGDARAAIQRMIFSSAETGWGEDEGVSLSADVLADGPVRTVVECTTRLPGDVIVTRRYELHDRFFIVDVSASRLCAGLFNRLWYATGGEYLDSAGTRADVDGRGDAEGVTEAAGSPIWYAVRNDAWTHLAVSLGATTGMSYWDSSPALGQLGFGTSQTAGNRYLHWLGPGPLSDARIGDLAQALGDPTAPGNLTATDGGAGL